MEKIEENIKKFLSACSGNGSGFGDGFGDGDGDGYGDGYGDGDGDGSGYGYGSGYGDGISEFNGMKVYQVDGVATIINSVHGSYAKGHVLNTDFTLTPCFIAKVENCFAHGESLRQARNDAMNKAMKRMPLEDRIERFREQYPDPDAIIPARELYEWHGVLTGSCEMGRKQFARDYDIDINRHKLSVKMFVKLTMHSYGSDAISKLAESYGIDLTENLKQ